MVLAAHPLVLSVATSVGGSYAEIDGINSVSFGPNRTMLETTDFKDTSAAKTRMSGLKDGVSRLGGDYESTDTTGQNVLRTAEDDGTSVFVKFLWDGSTGHRVECKVESYEISGEVDGKVQVTYNLTFTGAPVAI